MQWTEVYMMRPDLLAHTQAKAFLTIMGIIWKDAPLSVIKNRDARTYAKSLGASDQGPGDSSKLGVPLRLWKFPDGSAVLIAEGGEGIKLTPSVILAM